MVHVKDSRNDNPSLALLFMPKSLAQRPALRLRSIYSPGSCCWQEGARAASSEGSAKGKGLQITPFTFYLKRDKHTCSQPIRTSPTIETKRKCRFFLSFREETALWPSKSFSVSPTAPSTHPQRGAQLGPRCRLSLWAGTAVRSAGTVTPTVCTPKPGCKAA